MAQFPIHGDLLFMLPVVLALLAAIYHSQPTAGYAGHEKAKIKVYMHSSLVLCTTKALKYAMLRERIFQSSFPTLNKY